jgi:hypothetical protein
MALDCHPDSPPTEPSSSLEELARVPALILFVDRARTALPELALTETTVVVETRRQVSITDATCARVARTLHPPRCRAALRLVSQLVRR